MALNLLSLLLTVFEWEDSAMERDFPSIPGPRSVRIPAGEAILEGDLQLPAGAFGVILFAHGSGSSRHSPRNRFVAQTLRQAGLGTLLLDLLTPAEEAEDAHSAHLRFDIDLLAGRLLAATDWFQQQLDLPIGYFGASTGGGAALVAAAQGPEVAAVVSRGGRPDLAGPALPRVRVPTLLIVGGHDYPVIDLNERALQRLGSRDKQIAIVPGATHLFEEPGALEEVARLAAEWFTRHMAPAPVG
jgi:dienelactone hydrolase